VGDGRWTQNTSAHAAEENERARRRRALKGFSLRRLLFTGGGVTYAPPYKGGVLVRDASPSGIGSVTCCNM